MIINAQSLDLGTSCAPPTMSSLRFDDCGHYDYLRRTIVIQRHVRGSRGVSIASGKCNLDCVLS
jgi:hypothetical protein